MNTRRLQSVILFLSFVYFCCKEGASCKRLRKFKLSFMRLCLELIWNCVPRRNLISYCQLIFLCSYMRPCFTCMDAFWVSKHKKMSLVKKRLMIRNMCFDWFILNENPSQIQVTSLRFSLRIFPLTSHNIKSGFRSIKKLHVQTMVPGTSSRQKTLG
jgi:hypothetical protein